MLPSSRCLDYLERQVKFASKNKMLRAEAKEKISSLGLPLWAWRLLAEFPLCPLPKQRLALEQADLGCCQALCCASQNHDVTSFDAGFCAGIYAPDAMTADGGYFDKQLI